MVATCYNQAWEFAAAGAEPGQAQHTIPVLLPESARCSPSEYHRLGLNRTCLLPPLPFLRGRGRDFTANYRGRSGFG